MKSYRIEAMDLVDKTYTAIKEMILKRELVPGQKLIQEDIAKQLGVSRTPLLAAFSKLEKEYLVESRPRRGFYINELTLEDKLNLFDIRIRLEPLGAGRAAELGNTAEKKALLKIIENAPDFSTGHSFPLFYSHDFSFHSQIMEMCRNNMLTKMISSYNIISLSNQYEDDINCQDSLEDHRIITEAIVSGDAEKAEQAMEMHIRKGRERIREHNS